MNFTARTEALYGAEAIEILQRAHVAIFGLGGVGSWAAEALARTGIGELTIVDGDVVQESNINRQAPALYSTIGRDKCSVLKERFMDINPSITVHPHIRWYEPGFGDEFLQGTHPVDMVVDCIDDIKSKADLIHYCACHKIPIITAGGCARKKYSHKLLLTDIFSTSGDPLLKRLRKELRNLGVFSLPVIASNEIAISQTNDYGENGLASAIFVPASCGLELAQYVTLHLIGEHILPLPALWP